MDIEVLKKIEKRIRINKDFRNPARSIDIIFIMKKLWINADLIRNLTLKRNFLK